MAMAYTNFTGAADDKREKGEFELLEGLCVSCCVFQFAFLSHALFSKQIGIMARGN